MSKFNLKHFANLKSNKDELGKNWYEIATILTVALVYLGSGLLFYWTSPFLLKIVNDDINYNITEEEASYFTIIRLVSVMLLPPFLVPVINKIGKKNGLLACSIPFIISWLIKAYCTNLWLLYLSRLSVGIGDSLMYLSAVAYVSEIAKPEVRGVWGHSLTVFAFLAQLIINLLGQYFSVSSTSFICVIIPILFFAIFVFMPETPHFNIIQGRDDKAKESLRKLRRKRNIEDEFNNIKHSLGKQEMGTWRDLLTNETHRKALTITIFLVTAQNFSGLWTFGAYMQFIFEKSGTSISSESSTIIFAFVNVVLYSIAAYYSNKLGRRKSLIWSFLLTGLSLFIQGIYFIVETNYPSARVQWLPLVGMVLFLVFSSFGVGIIPFLMPGELFAIGIKSRGMAVFSSTLGLGGIITNTVFYYLSTYSGLSGPFLLFGTCCFISAFISYLIIPETKNKSLEEIQILLRDK